MRREWVDFEILEGLTFTAVKKQQNYNKDYLLFIETNGRAFIQFHEDECCESVNIEDINGSLTDLENSPILLAEEVFSNEEPAPEEDPEHYTWTFYKLSTVKGSVTIRWYGTSNGYYSETVSFFEIHPDRSDTELNWIITNEDKALLRKAMPSLKE